jgi:8-oxo-dGTP pyrophosphatase MutT (NUDIX family)
VEILFTLDSKDYEESIEVVYRPSARGVIIKEGKVAMIHSALYDYYKFPGGGIEAGESPVQAMIREVKEESGLTVITESIRELGNVHRRSRTAQGGLFVQDNFYFVCSCKENIGETNLDAYESEEGFTLEFVKPEDAINKNQNCNYEHKMPLMLKRESRVLELLIERGYFN